jgi:hypothetical protein
MRILRHSTGGGALSCSEHRHGPFLAAEVETQPWCNGNKGLKRAMAGREISPKIASSDQRSFALTGPGVRAKA